MNIKNIKNTKIAIKNPEHSILVQRALFKLGAEWWAESQHVPLNIDEKYLFVCTRKGLSWSDDADVFSEHDNTEIVYNPETREFEAAKYKHADMIMKYAEIAQTDPKPWRHFEYFSVILNRWLRMSESDMFRADYEYRFKKVQKVKVINSVEIPDITFIPEDCEEFIAPALSADGWQRIFADLESRWINYYLKNNLCYPNTEEGKSAAKLHSYALMSC